MTLLQDNYRFVWNIVRFFYLLASVLRGRLTAGWLGQNWTTNFCLQCPLSLSICWVGPSLFLPSSQAVCNRAHVIPAHHFRPSWCKYRTTHRGSSPPETTEHKKCVPVCEWPGNWDSYMCMDWPAVCKSAPGWTQMFLCSWSSIKLKISQPCTHSHTLYNSGSIVQAGAQWLMSGLHTPLCIFNAGLSVCVHPGERQEMHFTLH